MFWKQPKNISLGFSIFLNALFCFYTFTGRTENSDCLPMTENQNVQSDLRLKNHIYEVKSLAHHQFQQRRDLIKTYCQNNQNSSELKIVNQDTNWNKDLWFDYKNQLIFCQISKISSSTWVTNLMK